MVIVGQHKLCLRQTDHRSILIIVILEFEIFFDSNKLKTKTGKHKTFHELAKKCKIIFWKRFEQFLDFAKIKHIQKIKNFLDSSWKNLSAFFD